MKTEDLAKQLKELDVNLEIVPNPNNPGLSNIKYAGKDVCPVPSEEIREKPDPFYTYTFANGMMGRHKSLEEAMAQVNHVLNLIKTEEGRDLFFDR